MSQLDAIAYLKNQMETKITYHITYNDFLEFVEKFYGVPIELAEVNNYTTYEFNVKKEYNKSTEQSVKEEIEKGYTHDFRNILEDLCYKEYIEPGAYFIRAWW